MTDVIHRFSFEEHPIRGQWVRLENSTREALASQTLPDAVSELLHQQMAAVAMFADNLKFTGTVALQSRGDGALLRSVAECRDRQYLRSIAHIDADQPQPTQPEDLTAWLNDGQLALTLIPPADSQQTQYQGLIELREPTLTANLEAYFEQSEQLPARLFFANHGEGVSGLLLQRLPDPGTATEAQSAIHDEAWHTIVTLADTLTSPELAELPVQTLLQRLFSEYPCRLHPARPLAFKCTCSRQKTDQTLKVLPAAEITDILAELGQVEVNCEFCGAQYAYDAVDIAALRAGNSSESDGSIH